MQTLAGHLELTCAADQDGRSFLSHQSFQAPFHIGKPYADEHALMVQVVNPTAGLFAGDALRSEVRVEGGARLHLSTPSASRVHWMASGRAQVAQTFFVARGGWLEFLPAPLMPQKNCRYQQRTRIETEGGAELFFVEMLAPGRVARGECFQFTELDWESNLLLDGRLIARERFMLRPADESLHALQHPFPHGYYASCYLLTDRLTNVSSCWDTIRALNTKDLLLGVSPLMEAGWSIRVLARDSLTLQNSIRALRLALSTDLPQLRCQLRKV